MGTIVLSPQDCLSSPHNRRNHSMMFTSTSKVGRRSFQSLAPSLPAQDCASHNCAGGSPPGDGILPIPQLRRSFSKKAPSTKPASPFCTPPARITSTPSSSLARSASAILPTPLSSLTNSDRLHLLKGRLPFKIVQGNGPGSDGQHNQLHQLSKKPADARNRPRQNIAKGRASNGEIKELKETVKPYRDEKVPITSGHTASGKTKYLSATPESQRNEKGRAKEFDGQKRRNLEKSHSGKGMGDSSLQFEVPVVTILQRPKNEEAAVELIAKFFQKCSDRELANANGEMYEMIEKSDGLVTDSETELSASGVSDCESSEVAHAGVVCVEHTLSDVSALLHTSMEGFWEVGPASSPVDQHVIEPISAIEENGVLVGPDCEDLAMWERWAGPSYINSPPPSALPLPRFSRKHAKAESLAVMKQLERVSEGPRQLDMKLDAVATATNDLRRILNLDLCRM